MFISIKTLWSDHTLNINHTNYPSSVNTTISVSIFWQQTPKMLSLIWDKEDDICMVYNNNGLNSDWKQTQELYIYNK